MLRELRAFVLRGNLLDLAVAFILGAAFSAVVTAFSEGVLMALVAAVFGEPSFDSIVWRVGDGEVLIGSFLTALASFLVVAVALFALLKGVAVVRRGLDLDEPVAQAPAPSDETRLLTEIRDLLRDGGPGPSR